MLIWAAAAVSAVMKTTAAARIANVSRVESLRAASTSTSVADPE